MLTIIKLALTKQTRIVRSWSQPLRGGRDNLPSKDYYRPSGSDPRSGQGVRQPRQLAPGRNNCIQQGENPTGSLTFPPPNRQGRTISYPLHPRPVTCIKTEKKNALEVATWTSLSSAKKSSNAGDGVPPSDDCPRNFLFLFGMPAQLTHRPKQERH